MDLPWIEGELPLECLSMSSTFVSDKKIVNF